MAKGNIIEFYARHLANWLTRGELVDRGNLSSLGIKALFSQIITKAYVKRVICISKFPVNFKAPLINEINSIIGLEGTSVKAYLNTYSLPVSVNTKDDVFKRKMAKTEEDFNRYTQLFEELSDTDRSLGKTVKVGGGMKFRIRSEDLDRLRSSKESYDYVVNQVKLGSKFFNTFTFLEIMAKDTKELDRCMREVNSYLDNQGFIFTELSSNSSNFLSNYAPGSYLHEYSNKEFTDILASDENLSYLQSFISHGFIGNGIGQLIGMDMNSKKPLILNTFESGTKQVNLLYAPSGHGKTTEAFQLIMSNVSADVHCSYLDVKGDEGIKLLPYIPDLINIDFTDTSDAYINCLRLDDLEVTNVTEAREFYNMSVKTTVNLMRIIYQPETPRESADCDSICQVAVNKLFKSRDINYLRPASFKNSANLKYEDLIPMIAEINNSKSYSQFKDLIDGLRIKCTNKFVIEDTFKGREISLTDIIEAPLVVYCLNKNKDQSESVDNVIRSFMISYLDMKKISIRKSKGLFTAVFYEELQRKEEFKDLIKHICAMVTGARSSNVTVYLLCNTLAVLNGEDMAPIISNLSTCIIGPIVKENQDDYMVLDKIGCKSLRGYVELISNDENLNKNLFAIKFNTGKITGMTVFKCVMPQSVIDSLATRGVKVYE